MTSKSRNYIHTPHPHFFFFFKFNQRNLPPIPDFFFQIRDQIIFGLQIPQIYSISTRGHVRSDTINVGYIAAQRRSDIQPVKDGCGSGVGYIASRRCEYMRALCTRDISRALLSVPVRIYRCVEKLYEGCISNSQSNVFIPRTVNLICVYSRVTIYRILGKTI